MECDVAVLGGGPGGYTAAIRAAQLGAKVVCVEQEPELGGTCLRVGCIPTKAWVQTAHAMHQAGEVFAKFGVEVSQPQLNFGQAVEWKNGVVKQMTGGVAGLFKANGVEWAKGRGRFSGPNTISVEGGEEIQFKSAIVATGSFPLRPPIDGHRLAPLRRLDRPARADRGAAAARRARRRDHRLRVRVDLPALRQRGDDRRDARHADPAGGRRRGEGAREGLRQARDRAPARQAVQRRRGRRPPAARPLRRRRERRDRPDARLDRARPARRGARARGDRRPARPARRDRDRRAPADDGAAHLRRRRLRRLLAARAHGVPRGRGRGRECVRPRGDDRRSGGAAADLHRPGDRGRRPDRGAGARAATATTSPSACSRGSRTPGR